jgi:hypothetical protein
VKQCATSTPAAALYTSRHRRVGTCLEDNRRTTSEEFHHCAEQLEMIGSRVQRLGEALKQIWSRSGLLYMSGIGHDFIPTTWSG